MSNLVTDIEIAQQAKMKPIRKLPQRSDWQKTKLNVTDHIKQNYQMKRFVVYTIVQMEN